MTSKEPDWPLHLNPLKSKNVTKCSVINEGCVTTIGSVAECLRLYAVRTESSVGRFYGRAIRFKTGVRARKTREFRCYSSSREHVL